MDERVLILRSQEPGARIQEPGGDNRHQGAMEQKAGWELRDLRDS
jgi:hypothetical protein